MSYLLINKFKLATASSFSNLIKNMQFLIKGNKEGNHVCTQTPKLTETRILTLFLSSLYVSHLTVVKSVIIHSAQVSFR